MGQASTVDDILPPESLTEQSPTIEPSTADDVIPPVSLSLVKSDPVTPYDPEKPAIGDKVEQQLHAMGSGLYHSVVGGYKGLGTLAMTRDPNAAADAVNAETGKIYQPPPEDLSHMSPVARKYHEQNQLPPATELGDIAARHGASPGLSTALSVLPTAGAAMLAPRSMGGEAQSAAPGAESAQASKVAFDSPPVEGGLPPQIANDRAALLNRVGIENARHSALLGDAKSAATDYQLSKFDEPAGVAAKAQFDAEKSALTNHAAKIVDETGGSMGMDEDTLHARGQTIAAPFDKLRQYFDTQKEAAYNAASERAAGKPIGSLEGTAALLKDPDFTETLLAKNQGPLLDSINRQFQRFQALNPDGMTVENAENFRKWMNQIWTPDNSATLGKVKGALDDDVLKGAGEDIYGPARKIVQMEAQTLDNPKGVSKLMDFDPKNPLNRTTAHAKIPDALTRLDPAQFDNVIKTLDTMPQELQSDAQAAKAEIKAHLANKVLEAGSARQGQWDAPAVTKVIKANSAKLQSAFADQPQTLAKLQDLESAGKILKVDQSYPGAAAQAANALKRGAMSHVISKGAGMAGGAVGATAGGIIAGPPGAAVGGAAGSAVGSGLALKFGESAAESAALKRWNSGVSRLSDVVPKP
jgi:hypothetical protein